MSASVNIQIPQVGKIISNVDLHKLSANQCKEIVDSVYENKVVIIKNKSLDIGQFNDLSYDFGEPVPYLQSNYHHPDYPLIFVSSNVKSDGKSIGVARTGGYWHSDTAFLDVPIPLTMLYPQIIPHESARTTMFIDLEAAFAALPLSKQLELESLNFVHSGRWKYKVRAEDAGHDISEILSMIDHVQPPVVHPAVITHPKTGRKNLYLTRGFTIGIEGFSGDESDKLLAELFDHIEQDQFVHSFAWELGDLILWDNRFLAHRAGRLEGSGRSDEEIAEEETMVYRIIIRDGEPLSSI